MFLSISLTGHSPATDLGYLLAKHPERENCVSLAFGTARIFFPEATDERCIAVLMVDVDPVGLVRNGNQNANFALAQYVNDRPYAASSLLSTAISRTLGSALNGHCTHRPELVKKALEFEAHIPTLVATGGDAQVRRIFEPLGYSVETTTTALDPEFPAWGDSRTTGLRLRAKIRISDLLTHLFVLLLTEQSTIGSGRTKSISYSPKGKPGSPDTPKKTGSHVAFSITGTPSQTKHWPGSHRKQKNLKSLPKILSLKPSDVHSMTRGSIPCWTSSFPAARIP